MKGVRLDFIHHCLIRRVFSNQLGPCREVHGPARLLSRPPIRWQVGCKPRIQTHLACPFLSRAAQMRKLKDKGLHFGDDPVLVR